MLHYWHSFKQKYCKRRSAHATVAIKNWADEEKKRREEKRRAAAAAAAASPHHRKRSARRNWFSKCGFSAARGCFNSVPAKDNSSVVRVSPTRTGQSAAQSSKRTKKSDQTLRIGHACATSQRKALWNTMANADEKFLCCSVKVKLNPLRKNLKWVCNFNSLFCSY